MQGQAAALRGRGEDLSVAIAALEPFADEADRLLRVLDTQEQAVTKFVSDGGEVFGALVRAPGPAPGPDPRRATSSSARPRGRNEELAEAFTIFPTFLRESRATLTRLEEFAVDTDPVVTALRPSGRELEPTARELEALAPSLRSFFQALPATIKAAPAGMQATRRLLDDHLPPLLGQLDDWLGPVNAILEVVRRYRREFTGLANLAAASQGVFFDFGTAESVHYLRTESPLTPEAVAAYPRRLEITPHEPVPARRAPSSTSLRRHRLVRDAPLRVRGSAPRSTPASSTDPLFQERVDGDAAEATCSSSGSSSSRSTTSSTRTRSTPPGCTPQAPLDSVGTPSETSDYLHVRDLTNP